MSSQYKAYSLFTFLLLLLPMPAQPAAISANGTCQIGDCASPGTLAPGQSIGITNFSFIYTFANTDTFNVTGTYSASGNAPSISFEATASYIGNSTHTASMADTLSVDLLQNFSYNGGNPDGTYGETATLSQANVAPGSYVTAELSFNGQGIGLLGPYTGQASQTYSDSALLTGLTDPSLADFNYTFVLAAGSPAIPEPADFGLAAFGLSGLIAFAFGRRKRPASFI